MILENRCHGIRPWNRFTVRVQSEMLSSNTVDSISYVLFLFEKIKSPACPILFKFSGEICYGLIYSPLYEWVPQRKK